MIAYDALTRQYGKDLVERVQTLIKKARKHKVTIATAESLTAGGIAHLIVSLDEQKNVLSCGKVVYNNNAKATMLGVSREDLEQYEAVSEPVARQMAEGALQASDAQLSVAVTGYAGQWGDPSRNIDGGTVFVGVSHALAQQKCITHVEEMHFDGARSLDIRKTIIAAVSALELALDSYISNKTELQDTITHAMQPGVANDPWLKTIQSPVDAAYRNQSGEPVDSLLVQEYGSHIINRIKSLLTDAVRGNQKIAVTGDRAMSELAQMLTTLNGSSKVVDRGFILYDSAIRQHIPHVNQASTIEEKAKAAAAYVLQHSPATMVISAFTTAKHDVAITVISADARAKTEIVHFPKNDTPLSRQVAKHSLLRLEQMLQAQQQKQRA